MKQSTWTRVTTIANTLADRYALERWAQRNTVLGLGARQDLYALAASCTSDDKKQLNRIVTQAQEAAKARSGANLGTALHRLTERVHLEKNVELPDQWRPDVHAYLHALADNGFKADSSWIERVVIVPELMVAGTVDRLLQNVNGGSFIVGDLKTGQNALKFGGQEIAMQLALYAHATHAWRGKPNDIERDSYGRYLLPHPDDAPDDYDSMPMVEREWALALHLPVGKGECTLYRVDLVAGKQAVQQALWVRKWRRRKNLVSVLNGRGITNSSGSNDDW